MSLPIEMMASISAAMVGKDLTPPPDNLTIQPAAEAMARLQRLHETAGHLAEDAPSVLAHPEAARGLEQALIEAMMHRLGDGETYEDRAALRQHAAIMRRFHRVVEEHLDDPLYIPGLCREIGTSLRTLHASCQEHLGMGAKRYLLLRRMNMVRRALRESAPHQTTVTEVATRYAVWQFGRFAVAYKALFGEDPSATLARAASYDLWQDDRRVAIPHLFAPLTFNELSAAQQECAVDTEERIVRSEWNIAKSRRLLESLESKWRAQPL